MPETRPKNPEVCKPETVKIGPFRFVAEVCKGRYYKHYHKNTPHLALDAALVAIILILLGVIINTYVFNRAKVINLVALDVRTTPSELVNGAQGSFAITYTNTTGDTLADAALVLRFPKGLRNPQVLPAEYNTATNTLPIGTLAPKAHGTVTVTGVLLGNLGARERILAVVSYKDAFGRPRQEFSTLELPLNRSAFETTITLPDKLISGSPFDATLTVKNGMLVDFDAATITVAGDGLRILTTDLKPSEQRGTYTVPLTAGQEQRFSIRSVVTTQEPANASVTARVTGQFEGHEYVIGSATSSVPVVFSKFLIRFNEGADTPKAIDAGGSATLRIYYKNTEPFAAKNVRIAYELSGAFADTRTIGVEHSFDTIGPGEEGSFDVTVKALPSIPFSKETADQTIAARVIASYEEDAEPHRAVSIESVPYILPVNSSTELTSFGLFYSSFGDQIGVGPIPPMIGEYTSYFAVVKITNTVNPINGAVLRARVPEWVEFTDRASTTLGERMRFDGRFIEWNIGAIPAYAGIFSPAPELRIELAITPTKAWIGKAVPLLSDIVLTGVDQRTASPITAKGADITTAIFKDDRMNKVVQ